MKTIETIVHYYNFDISNDDQAKAWKALRAKLRRTHKLFDVMASPAESKQLEGGVTELLETNTIFDNQWNTVSGERIFDWYLGIVPNKHIKRGHYIDLTPEVLAVRKNTLKCGYCDHQESLSSIIEEPHFCTECVGSVYLEEGNVPLTLMKPVDSSGYEYKDFVIPEDWLDKQWKLHIEAKTIIKAEAKEKYFKNKKEANDEKYLEAVRKLGVEHKGFDWLIEHKISLENIIYYSHTNNFCVGWRHNGLTEAEVSFWKDLLEDFPYDLEFKTK